MFSDIFLGKVATFGDHSLIGLEVIQRFSKREGLNRVKIQFKILLIIAITVFSKFCNEKFLL